MNWFKIGGWVAGGLAALGLLIGAYTLVTRTLANASAGKLAKRCQGAATSPTAELADCAEPIGTLIGEARQARTCDQAIATYRAAATSSADRGRAAFAIKMSCSEGVKREIVQVDALAHDLENARSQIIAARADTAAAVSRAEARATSTAKRKASDDRVIADQPRTADGRLTCDSVCLRRLSEAP